MKSFISSIIALALCSSSWYANWINSGSPGIIDAIKEVILAHFIAIDCPQVLKILFALYIYVSGSIKGLK